MTMPRTNINPLSQLGVRSPNPPRIYSVKRSPTTKDWQGFFIFDEWQDTSASPPDAWLLVDIKRSATSGNIEATWIKFAGVVGDIITLTGNTGGAVPPDAAGNINTIGDGTIVVTGVPATNTLTWSAPGSGAVFTVQTTDAVKTVIFNNAVAASQVVMIQGFILMGQDDYTAGFFGTFYGAARKPAVGATVLIGTPVTNWSHDFAGVPRIDVEIDGDSIELNVTGIAVTTLNWRAVVALQIEQT